MIPEKIKLQMYRNQDGKNVVYIDRGHGFEELPHYLKHSPDGFEWGYGGSGPAELARSILKYCLCQTGNFTKDSENEHIVELYYQKFKWELISNLKMNVVKITFNLRKWLREQGVYWNEMFPGGKP